MLSSTSVHHPTPMPRAQARPTWPRPCAPRLLTSAAGAPDSPQRRPASSNPDPRALGPSSRWASAAAAPEDDWGSRCPERGAVAPRARPEAAARPGAAGPAADPRTAGCPAPATQPLPLLPPAASRASAPAHLPLAPLLVLAPRRQGRKDKSGGAAPHSEEEALLPTPPRQVC